MLTHYTVIAVRRYLVRGAIALRTTIAVFGIWCEGRSHSFEQALRECDRTRGLIW